MDHPITQAELDEIKHLLDTNQQLSYTEAHELWLYLAGNDRMDRLNELAPVLKKYVHKFHSRNHFLGCDTLYLKIHPSPMAANMEEKLLITARTKEEEQFLLSLMQG